MTRAFIADTGTHRSLGGEIQIKHTILWETQGPQGVIMVGGLDDYSICHRYKAHIGPDGVGFR